MWAKPRRVTHVLRVCNVSELFETLVLTHLILQLEEVGTVKLLSPFGD